MLDGLGEQKLKDYGERLVKIIQTFVKEENLEDVLASKKNQKIAGTLQPAKKRRVENPYETHRKKGGSSNTDSANKEEDDEFPLDVDFSRIVLPADEEVLVATPTNKSKYFS